MINIHQISSKIVTLMLLSGYGTRYAARGVKKMKGRKGERETIRSTEHKVKDLETKGPQDYVICIIGDV